jgi:hypothetical protein
MPQAHRAPFTFSSLFLIWSLGEVACSGYIAAIRTSVGMYTAFSLAASFFHSYAGRASLIVMTEPGKSPGISGCFTDERIFGV